MKKYISMFMFALLGCFALVSCDTETDESAGGTAVEQMAAAAGSSYNPSNAEAGNVELLEGQVLLNQGKNLHGLPCDSICYKVKFSDDDNGLTYRVSGVRHSGFYE